MSNESESDRQGNSEFASKVDETVGRARRKVEETVGKAREAAERAREEVDERTAQLRDGYARVQDRARHTAGDITTFVEESPARAVLLAAAVGFLFGLLFRLGGRD